MFDPTKYTKSKWLKGSDLNPDQYIAVTIERAFEQAFERETKPVLEFSEIDQSLILNRTQVAAMINLFGTDPQRWIGQRINLSAVPSDYQGKSTILIEAAAPNFGGQPLRDEDIPF